MSLEDLTKKAFNGEELTTDERNSLFFYYRHIPNRMKTDEEWEVYCRMAKGKDNIVLDRSSYIRPLHEYHDEFFQKLLVKKKEYFDKFGSHFPDLDISYEEKIEMIENCLKQNKKGYELGYFNKL